ncbi:MULTISPECIES: hypothetical protein [unclassified Streptomyces]|uniref:hypothetical protein n=1 Tax=unclassified Streptomyces TaxID=2593676 RepID=UPI003D8C13EA
MAWLLKGAGYVLAALGAGAFAAVAWLVGYLVVVPARWLYQYVLTPLGHGIAWVAAGAVRAVHVIGTGAGVALYWIVRVVLVPPALAVGRWVLAPVGRVLWAVGREIGAAFGHAWRVAGHVSLVVGRFLGTLMRWIFVEPVRWAYRMVLTPIGHVLREAVLRPAAAAAHAVGRAARRTLALVRESARRATALVRESARQARADLRRMLIGDPGGPRTISRREPKAAETRTLGSSTTALTKD